VLILEGFAPFSLSPKFGANLADKLGQSIQIDMKKINILDYLFHPRIYFGFYIYIYIYKRKKGRPRPLEWRGLSGCPGN
jgi:hypothetical protein